jgi:hypothetical protein
MVEVFKKFPCTQSGEIVNALVEEWRGEVIMRIAGV